MADDPTSAEPRAAGRRYFDPEGIPQETPRFSLDGEIERYIPDPPDAPENLEKGRQPLPHAVYKARVAVIAALKAEGYSRKDIAEAMGMTPSGVDWCLRTARKRNLLQDGMVEALREMDQEAVPHAVENLINAIREGNLEVSMDVVKGRGLLRNWSNNKNDSPAAGPNMAFQFNFVMPDGKPAANADQLTGKIIGTGRT